MEFIDGEWNYESQTNIDNLLMIEEKPLETLTGEENFTKEKNLFV